jgi:hypothetical protein
MTEGFPIRRELYPATPLLTFQLNCIATILEAVIIKGRHWVGSRFRRSDNLNEEGFKLRLLATTRKVNSTCSKFCLELAHRSCHHGASFLQPCT